MSNLNKRVSAAKALEIILAESGDEEESDDSRSSSSDSESIPEEVVSEADNEGEDETISSESDADEESDYDDHEVIKNKFFLDSSLVNFRINLT
jgi:hypothetical protein